MGALMKQMSLNGAQIFRPLPLDVDQRPLAAAEGEVLQAGEEEPLLLGIVGYPIRVQVTPAGMAPSSTVIW